MYWIADQDPDTLTDEQIEKWLKLQVETLYHPVSSLLAFSVACADRSIRLLQLVLRLPLKMALWIRSSRSMALLGCASWMHLSSLAKLRRTPLQRLLPLARKRLTSYSAQRESSRKAKASCDHLKNVTIIKTVTGYVFIDQLLHQYSYHSFLFVLIAGRMILLPWFIKCTSLWQVWHTDLQSSPRWTIWNTVVYQWSVHHSLILTLPIVPGRTIRWRTQRRNHLALSFGRTPLRASRQKSRRHSYGNDRRIRVYCTGSTSYVFWQHQREIK